MRNGQARRNSRTWLQGENAQNDKGAQDMSKLELIMYCPDGVHSVDFSRAVMVKLSGTGWAVGIPGPRNIIVDAARRMSQTQMEDLIRAQLAADKAKRLFLYPFEEPAIKIAEDCFLYNLCKLDGEWTKSQIEILQSHSKDKRFRERFARAMENGKPPPLFDRIDMAILFNWRTFRFRSGRKMVPHGLPGLRDWSPHAAGQLFVSARLFSVVQSDYADGGISAAHRYKKRCQRLRLDCKRRYAIRDFYISGNQVKVVRA